MSYDISKFWVERNGYIHANSTEVIGQHETGIIRKRVCDSAGTETFKLKDRLNIRKPNRVKICKTCGHRQYYSIDIRLGRS